MGEFDGACERSGIGTEPGAGLEPGTGPAPGTGRERGSVSTEFAVALPGVVLILGLLLSLAMHGAAQVSLEEGARAAARELARGEDPSAAEQTASRVAGQEVSTAISRDGEYSHVELTRPVRLLGLVELDLDQSAEASARTEHVPAAEDSP